MTAYREGLAAGTPLVLPTGLVVLAIERTLTTAHGAGDWRCVLSRREPLALLLRWPDGSVDLMAAGSSPVSPEALRDAMPGWDRLLDGLHAAADRSAPLAATPVRPA